MKWLRALRVKVSDWWRPIYYGRILGKKSTKLVIPKMTIGTRSEVRKHD